MEYKYIILICLILVASIVIVLYWISFYKKPALFKNKAKLDGELLKMDRIEKSWIFLSNTNMKYKNNKWILFDNIIITDNCVYFINDISSFEKIISPDFSSKEWLVIKKEKENTILNPIYVYENQVKKLKKIINFDYDYKILLIVPSELEVIKYPNGFSVNFNELFILNQIIKDFENKTKFTKTINMKAKKDLLIRIQNTNYEVNKKLVLNIK